MSEIKNQNIFITIIINISERKSNIFKNLILT